MPLTERVIFKTALQRGNRLQIPKYVRWHYQLETNQILKATVQSLNTWTLAQTFLTRMTKDGRIDIPNLTAQLLRIEENPKRYILQVILEPA